MEADHLLPPVLESSYWVEICTISSDLFFFFLFSRSATSDQITSSHGHQPQSVDELVILLHLQPESTSSVQVVRGFSGAANTVSHR